MLDPLTDPAWPELVANSAQARIYHHPAWLGLLRGTYGYPVEAWCVEDESGRLLAGLAVAAVRSRLTGARLVSLPFSDSCEALYRKGVEPRDAGLAAVIERERRRHGLRLEIHGEAPEGSASTPGDRFLEYRLPLGDGLDAVLARMHPSKRRYRRRLERDGEVRVQRRTDTGALATFFHLHVLTRHRLGVPTQPWRLFERLQALFAQGLGFVSLCFRQDTAVAAAVYLKMGRTLTYKYGASDPAHAAVQGMLAIHVDAVRTALDSGCDLLDLGRTELDNPGLQRNKAELGAERHELSYSWLGAAPAAKRSVRTVSGLQSAAIRRAPPAFGRLLGAAVYKHFA